MTSPSVPQWDRNDVDLRNDLHPAQTAPPTAPPVIPALRRPAPAMRSDVTNPPNPKNTLSNSRRTTCNDLRNDLFFFGPSTVPTADQGGADLSAIRERIVTLHRSLSRGRGAAADTGGRLRRKLGQGVRIHGPPEFTVRKTTATDLDVYGCFLVWGERDSREEHGSELPVLILDGAVHLCQRQRPDPATGVSARLRCALGF